MIGELLEAGAIRPVIDKVFVFDQAKEALAYVEKGRAKGKVVVQIRYGVERIEVAEEDAGGHEHDSIRQARD